MRVLLLHPGAMGASIGAALVGNGHDVAWVSAGRGEATCERAQSAGLTPLETLAEGAAFAELTISVCPPEAALDVAAEVAAADFKGIYLDANAVAPATAERIGAVCARYVDGGIIGPPAWREGATRLYLAGDQAPTVAALFAGSLVDARVVSGGAGGVGAASALKMCYAAFTKGSSALLLGVRALAAANGVTADLLAEWEISQPQLAARSAATAKSVSPKAWRFAGEMREIASTFAAADLPDGFHGAAAALYERLAGLKDDADADLDAVLAALLR